MKIRNMLIGILSLIYTSLSAFCVPNFPAVENERLIVIAKQNYPYTATSPVDPNHQFMRSLNIFSQAAIDQMDTDTLVDLQSQYGIDLTDANPAVIFDPSTGSRTLPGVVTYFPTVLGNVPGQPFVIIEDTKHPNRNYRYLQYEVGNLVVFLGSYTVIAGTQVGAVVSPGSIFFRNYLIHAKRNRNLSLPKNREIFFIRSTQAAVTTPNMYGDGEFIITYPIFDCRGREGLGLSTTAIVHIPPTDAGIPHVQGSIVLSWPKANN